MCSHRKLGETCVRCKWIDFSKFLRPFWWCRSCWSKDVSGSSGMHRSLKVENTSMNTTTWEYLACTGPDYLGEVENRRTFYGNRCGTRVVWGFKLRFTSLYNAGFPSYTVSYRSICWVGSWPSCIWNFNMVNLSLNPCTMWLPHPLP